ncbi:MAG: GNAT family N-acetyltransferase [Myxococcales bacterium]|nr:GNAT family N-acetyltransferase [Myxococcales bacterium]
MIMREMIIREVGPADLARILQLEALCFGAEAWTSSMVAEEFSRLGGIFLGVGEPLDAYICGWAIIGELHLLQLAVHPDVRRTGLATQLHDALLKAAAPRAECGWLEVKVDNGGAICFYERLGWVPIGRRPRYYADGNDAIVFRLSCLDRPS